MFCIVLAICIYHKFTDIILSLFPTDNYPSALLRIKAQLSAYRRVAAKSPLNLADTRRVAQLQLMEKNCSQRKMSKPVLVPGFEFPLKDESDVERLERAVQINESTRDHYVRADSYE